MTIQQLKYAIMVAETTTLNEAAKQLYISQPSLSFAIKALEDELGDTIFERTSKGMSVTKRGREFLRKAKEVVHEFEALNGHFSGEDMNKTVFSVSSQHYTFVAEAFSELVKNHAESDYELTLNEAKTLEVLEDVKTFRSEVGIIYMNANNRTVINRILNEGSLVFKELFITYPFILVGSGNPLAAKTRVGISDLLEYPCISFVQEDLAPDWFSEEVISILKQRKIIRISDKGALDVLLAATDAYVVSTGIYLQSTDERRTVVIPLDTDCTDNEVHVGVIKRRDKVESPVCTEFCAIMDRIVKEGAPQGHHKRYF